MDLIRVLDQYIAGNFREGNQIFGKECVDTVCTDGMSLVHPLFVEFKNKGLEFEVVEPPESLEDAVSFLKRAEKQEEKYVYALYVLKFKNPVAEAFVDTVLERIGA